MRTPFTRPLFAALLMSTATALPAFADPDDPAPYGGLEGEALEAAREGADGDRYVDPDRDPTRDPDEQDALLGPPPEPPPLREDDPGILGDGEIVIEDGAVVEGLTED